MNKDSKWFRLAWPFVLGVALVMAIAYIAPDPVPKTAELATGKYDLETAIDGQSNKINGPVYFEYSDKQDNSMESRIFKLHFVNPLIAEGPGFGFLIPISGTDEMIEQGEYSVDEQSGGVMKRFDTVFGYADLGGKTSALYFSESGSISISGCTPREVLGEIDMVLHDGIGGSLRVTGAFKARPLPSNISM
ncbi:hypothetical protein [Robiginitalea sp.]|jgi:hypothetical protein|uniref:hypothetical protein n=1 Tax=Robiginitalea sp. TaxID=1902411 RepID=UPI003C712A14